MARTAASPAFQLHWTGLLMVEMMQLYVLFLCVYVLPPPTPKAKNNLSLTPPPPSKKPSKIYTEVSTPASRVPEVK